MTNEQNLKQQIIEKAWTEPDFKQQLIANPKAAIKDAFQLEAPDSIDIEVVEDSSSKYFLVIPQNPADVSSTDDVQGPRWT